MTHNKSDLSGHHLPNGKAGNASHWKGDSCSRGIRCSNLLLLGSSKVLLLALIAILGTSDGEHDSYFENASINNNSFINVWSNGTFNMFNFDEGSSGLLETAKSKAGGTFMRGLQMEPDFQLSMTKNITQENLGGTPKPDMVNDQALADAGSHSNRMGGSEPDDTQRNSLIHGRKIDCVHESSRLLSLHRNSVLRDLERDNLIGEMNSEKFTQLMDICD